MGNEDDELQEDNDNDDEDNDDEKNDDDGNCPDESTVAAAIEETMMESVSEIEEDVESLSEKKLTTSQAVVKVQEMFKRIPGFESSISLFCAKEKTGKRIAKDLKSNYSSFVKVKIDNINFKEPQQYGYFKKVSEFLLTASCESDLINYLIQLQQKV